jgi:hypothetical protein
MSSLSRLNPNFKAAFDAPRESQALLRKLAKLIQVQEAYLFGSGAQGKNTADSDLDLLVVIPDEASELDYFEIVSQPGFSSLATDWIFRKKSQFLSEQEIGGVTRVAIMTGIKVFPYDS